MKHYKKTVINQYNKKQEVKILNACAEIPLELEEVDFVFVKKNGVYEGTDSCKYPFKVIHYELGIPCRFHDFRDTHATKLIESGADITLMYHSVDNAKDHFLNCHALDINKQKGVLSIEPNHGNTKSKNIFMDTYVMKKALFLELVQKAHKLSSMYTLADIVREECEELDVRAYSHRGFFATITDFNSYYEANMELINLKKATDLFDDNWPIYTRTNDSCPTQYFDGSEVKSSVISNGCLIEGTIENSVIGRGCIIKEGAIVKNCVINADVVIGKGVHVENLVIDKHARLIRGKRVIAAPEKPGYIKRGDRL